MSERIRHGLRHKRTEIPAKAGIWLAPAPLENQIPVFAGISVVIVALHCSLIWLLRHTIEDRGHE
jgi:hypothetical protein